MVPATRGLFWTGWSRRLYEEIMFKVRAKKVRCGKGGWGGRRAFSRGNNMYLAGTGKVQLIEIASKGQGALFRFRQFTTYIDTKKGRVVKGASS